MAKNEHRCLLHHFMVQIAPERSNNRQNKHKILTKRNPIQNTADLAQLCTELSAMSILRNLHHQQNFHKAFGPENPAVHFVVHFAVVVADGMGQEERAFVE